MGLFNYISHYYNRNDNNYNYNYNCNYNCNYNYNYQGNNYVVELIENGKILRITHSNGNGNGNGNDQYEISRVSSAIYKLIKLGEMKYYHIMSHDGQYSAFLHSSQSREQEMVTFKEGNNLKMYRGDHYVKSVSLTDNDEMNTIYNIYHALLAYIQSFNINL